MNPTRVLLVAIPFSILFAAFQTTFLTRIPLFGHILQLLVIGSLAWGLLRGAVEGCLWALVAGLTLDLYSLTPFGLNTLAIISAVLATIVVQRLLPENRTYIPILLGTAGTGIYIAAYALLSQLSGLPPYWGFFTRLPGYLITQAVGMIAIYPLFFIAIQFLFPESDPRQLGRRQAN